MARHRLHNATCGHSAPVRLNACHTSSLYFNTGHFGELVQLDTSLGSPLGITPRHRIVTRRRAVLVPQPCQYRQARRNQIERRYQLTDIDRINELCASTKMLVDLCSLSKRASWYRRLI